MQQLKQADRVTSMAQKAISNLSIQPISRLQKQKQVIVSIYLFFDITGIYACAPRLSQIGIIHRGGIFAATSMYRKPQTHIGPAACLPV